MLCAPGCLFVLRILDFDFFLVQDEWTGEQKLQYTDIPDDIEPEEIRPLGNYAVEITWPDGFNQVFSHPYFDYTIIHRAQLSRLTNCTHLVYTS